MNRSRIAAAILASVITAGGACADDEAWVVLHSDNQATVSAHRPIGSEPPSGQLWVKADYARRQKLHGFAYASERYLAQVYCENGTIIRTNWQLFAKPGLAGKSRDYVPKDAMAWTIAPDTVDDWVARAACAKR
jgi:hypothetical protein